MAIFYFPGYNILTSCAWLPLNNVLFQLANLSLVVLYIGDFISFPSTFHYMIFLRLTLAATAAFFSTWGFWVLCSPDTGMWNLVFVVYNLCQLIWISYKQYSPKVVKPRFERLYNICYKNSGMRVEMYNKLIMGGTILTVSHLHTLHKCYYMPDKLVQIISGKLAMYLANGKIVKLRAGDFVNYDTWDFNSAMSECGVINVVDKYEVLEETTLISWTHTRLRELVKSNDAGKHALAYVFIRDSHSLLLNLTNVSRNAIKLDIFGSEKSASEENVDDDTVRLTGDVKPLENGVHEYVSEFEQGPDYLPGYSPLIEAESNV